MRGIEDPSRSRRAATPHRCHRHEGPRSGRTPRRKEGDRIRQVSWLPGHRLAPPSRALARPVASWESARRSQLRGQPRSRLTPHRVPSSSASRRNLFRAGLLRPTMAKVNGHAGPALNKFPPSILQHGQKCEADGWASSAPAQPMSPGSLSLRWNRHKANRILDQGIVPALPATDRLLRQAFVTPAGGRTQHSCRSAATPY